jgi:hypothetical protein
LQTFPKRVAAIYNNLPSGKLAGIAQRDAAKPAAPAAKPAAPAAPDPAKGKI